MKLEALPNTPQWYAARRGCLTASRMKDVLAVGAKGQPLKARDDYLMELVAERMTGIAATHFVTDAMQWGLDTEDAAVGAYEEVSGNLCSVAGFYLHDRIEFFGASPDRLIDPDGLLEIKCPTTVKYLAWLRAGVVPEEHKAQMLVQLACTKRSYVDFCAFDPRVQIGPKVFIRRYEPTAEEIANAESAAEAFLAEVESVFQMVTQEAA